jgi:histidine ammonia-lyase
MAELILDGSGLSIGRVARIAREGGSVAIADAVWQRLDAARAVVEAHLEADVPVYGLNTGLGGNLGHRLAPDEIEAFQAQLVRGRAVAMGPPLPKEVVRAAMLVRANGIAAGASGLSPPVLTALVELINRGVTPVVPSRGSIGVADLAPMAHVGLVLLGLGEAEHDGRTMPGLEALRAAGLAPLRLAAKDGLGLISSNAPTIGHAALVLCDARRLITSGAAIAALACEGYGANLSAFDARTAGLRPAPGQVEAAALLRAMLAGSSLAAPGAARSVQDALCFRCLPQVLGAGLDAASRAVAITEMEINAASDSPAVLVDAGAMLSNGNFHLGVLALAFETLALALAQVAQASLARCIKLMSAAHSGLPRYLSPVGGASAGLVPMQKAAGALLAEIRLKAQPVSADGLAISDFTEDLAPHAPLAVRKLDEQLPLIARLIAIEALGAAQAVDLRKPDSLGAGCAIVHGFVRETSPRLDDDRGMGQEAEQLAIRLLAGELAGRLGAFRPLPSC